MHALSVGQPYPHKLPESVQYNFRAGAHELLMVFSRPSGAEIADVRQGEAEFGLAVVGDVLFFLYRFGRAVKWSDAPYSIHLVPAAERTVPELPETRDTRALLSVILIEAGSMIVRAQFERPWNSAAYDRQIEEAYQRYPDTCRPARDRNAPELRRSMNHS